MSNLEKPTYKSWKTSIALFQLLIHGVLIFLSLAAIMPFVLLISSALTHESSLLVDGYSFWPQHFSLDNFNYVFRTNRDSVFRAYSITIFITVVGTSISLSISPMLAYALSRKDYNKRRVIGFMVFFIMIFNGGLVAQYTMWTRIFFIRNTIFALIFPNLLMNGFQIMLMRSFFTINIHPSLVEAAKIDGAGEFRIYYQIVVPLSLPIITVIGLMVGLAYWNDWTNGLYYITDVRLFSLQNVLNRILMNARFLAAMSTDATVLVDLPNIGIRMAMGVIGALPILVLYPFFQRFFIKGITLGGVKE